ncbi:MAG: DEAD/DEAH box helicase family protein [bacterium]|nr:DEAD/DEAH box helicase family protein [bacterium]
MIPLDDFLSRADDETLSGLIGTTAMKLIMTLDPRIATPANLRKIAIELHTREGLLLSREYRALLIDLLKPDEAKILASILGIKSKDDVYSELKQLSIRRGSEREKNLFDFFELLLPQEEVVEEKSSFSQTECQYPLFAHQRVAVKDVQNKLYHHPHRVLLHMPTGAGKTRTAMNIIAEHLRQNEPTVVIWLAHSEELCEQSASEFERAWKSLGNRNVGLWRFWGNHEINPDDIHDGVIVAGLAKTYSATRKQIAFIVKMARHASLVIIDEAHSAVAETYRLVLDSLVFQRKSTALLGLTATPGRTWADIHIDEQLANFFSRQKVTLKVDGYDNPVDYLVKEQYLADVDYRQLFYDGGVELSEADIRRVKDNFDIPENILKLFAEDEMRNLAIITTIEKLTKRHQRILVFAATVDHANLIASVLHIRGYQAHSVTSGTNSRLRARYIEEFKSDADDVRILCNFGVLTTGFDAPRTSAALIARPTKSLVLYSQMVGRAIRGLKAGGNVKAEIVTVVDNELPGFGSVSEAFNNWEDVWE